MGPVRVGIDIGGTFTDTVMIDDAGTVVNVKVPSTPPSFADGFMAGLERLPAEPHEVAFLGHCTTVGINAIIERAGARTAVVTTRGFRDTLAIRRGDREDQFNLWWQPQEELVPRRLRFEVDERIDYAGKVVRPIDPDSVDAVVRAVEAADIGAVAIVFLNSFANPDHEQAMKARLLAELPDVFVAVSHEILPEILEYERTSTTVATAYIGPVMDSYISRLEQRVRAAGYGDGLMVGTSTGGIATPDMVRRSPARTLESGPAAGVMAGLAIGRACGAESLVTFDMGGTSLDVGMIVDGEAQRTSEYAIEWRTPVRFPSVDVFSIGAGGGSIAWLDAGGSLQVGPKSAGANPGPACYGRGGDAPTTTDAQVVLGRIADRGLLGGEMSLDPELAADAIRRHVADPLGLTLEQAAAGILTISNNVMTTALRLATVERGHDPRDFSLFACGGGGPLSGAEVAAAADIPRVIVPPFPGLISALGLLLIDIRYDLTKSLLLGEDQASPALVAATFAELEAEVSELLEAEVGDGRPVTLLREVDVRYFGQSDAITVPVRPGDFDGAALELVFATFRDAQLREYGYELPRDVARAELVTARVAGIAETEKSALEPVGPSQGTAAPTERRSVSFGGDARETRIYDRATLPLGTAIDGPAVVEQPDTTTLIPPDMSAVVDAMGNIVIDTSGSAA